MLQTTIRYDAVDNFKGAINFFKHLESVKEYIEQNKEYPATKQILKVGGILLCNDSHGFVLPKEKAIDLNRVKEKMKGLKYTLVAENYLFQKIK